MGTLKKILFSFSFVQADGRGDSSAELAILLGDGNRRFCIGNLENILFSFSLLPALNGALRFLANGTEDGQGRQKNKRTEVSGNRRRTGHAREDRQGRQKNIGRLKFPLFIDRYR